MLFRKQAHLVEIIVESQLSYYLAALLAELVDVKDAAAVLRHCVLASRQ